VKKIKNHGFQNTLSNQNSNKMTEKRLVTQNLEINCNSHNDFYLYFVQSFDHNSCFFSFFSKKLALTLINQE
jgi:hypothetical protein